MTKIRFWGVRGSKPTPLTGAEIRTKIQSALSLYAYAKTKPDLESFCKKIDPLTFGTYGGNTSCVEVISDEVRFILDMGTGLSLLGNSLIKEMIGKKGLEIVFLLSHVHWDHIQGLPFFAPLYFNKQTGIKNRWSFYGGTNWQETAEICMKGQMNPPVFPVSWKEIVKFTEQMSFADVYDLMSFQPVANGPVIKCRKLNHPQETYGWRIESKDGKIVVYTTDNEPYDPNFPDPKLVSLAKNADVWITDCQYTQNIYNGVEGGVPRHGWGHSYPEAVAKTAVLAGVKQVILFHHDPTSSDEKVFYMQNYTKDLLCDMQSKASVIAAHEELEIIV